MHNKSIVSVKSTINLSAANTMNETKKKKKWTNKQKNTRKKKMHTDKQISLTFIPINAVWESANP